MSAYGAMVDVSDASSYPSTPQVSVPFEPRSVMFTVQNADGVVYVSFDGKDDHAQLRAGYSNETVSIPGRHKKLWLRKDAGTNPTYVWVTVVDQAEG